MSIFCRLIDGRNVDLATRSGADAYLQQAAGFSFSTTINMVTEIYKKEKTKQTTKQQVSSILAIVCEVLAQASDHLIENLLPKEIECWVDFATMLLRDRSMDQKWINHCALEDHDKELFNALIASTSRANVLNVALSRGTLNALAELFAARKAPDMPDDQSAELLCAIFSNACITLRRSFFTGDYNLAQEAIMKKLESAGLLAQFIRCSTVPNVWKQFDKDNTYQICVNLISCQVLIRKKFRRGKPCGDIVHNVLMGKDGHTCHRDQTVLNHLKTIQQLAENMENDALHEHEIVCICRHCSKRGKGYAACARCLTAHYCSRECQKKDWKKHKKSCSPMTKEMYSARKSGNALVQTFIEKNACMIVKAFQKKMKETMLPIQELVMELDFHLGCPSEGRVPPALRDPPEFKIGVTTHYIKHYRHNLSAWFEEVHECTIASLRNMYKKMTPENYLVLVMQPTGPSVMRLIWNELEMLEKRNIQLTMLKCLGLLNEK